MKKEWITPEIVKLRVNSGTPDDTKEGAFYETKAS